MQVASMVGRGGSWLGTQVANALTDGTLASAVVAAILSGRVQESDAISFYNGELSSRAERILTVVKFVYQANRLHGEQPFWKSRHDALGNEPLPVARIMRHLSRDPSIRYFHAAFSGMGVDRASLAPLDEELDRLTRNDRDIGRLLWDLDAWVPVLRQRVTLRRGPGIYNDRVMVGLEADNDGVIDFTGDRFTAAALEAIDGTRTARAIIDSVVATALPDERLFTQFKLVASFADMHRRRIIDARPAHSASGPRSIQG
jgi:hypothetical protein